MAHKVQGREEADRHMHGQSHVLESQTAPLHGWRVLLSPPLQPRGYLICPRPPCEGGLRSWQGHCSRTARTVATRFCGSAGRCQARSLHPPEHLQGWVLSEGVPVPVTAGFTVVYTRSLCSNETGSDCSANAAKLYLNYPKFVILEGTKLVVSTSIVLHCEQQCFCS